MRKIVIPLLGCCFVIALLIYYLKPMENETSPDDVNVEAILKQNNNARMDHKDVMIEVFIDKKKKSQNTIYSYTPGLWHISFDDREEDGFFTPNTIEINGGDEQLVFDSLVSQKIINPTVKKEQLNLVSFWSPQESGIHRARMYFQSEGFDSNDDMYLIYVHKEKGLFGQDKGWTKLFTVQPEW